MSADTEAAPRRLRYPAMVELVILGGLALVLMIALFMIRALVAERSTRARAAHAEIASSWGRSQKIGGPVLIVPYVVRYIDGAGRQQVVMHRARFLPAQLEVKG